MNTSTMNFSSGEWVVDTLEELGNFVKSQLFDTTLEEIWNLDDRTEAVEQLKEWERKQKEKFHPEKSCEDLKQLKDQAISVLQSDSEEKHEEHRNLVLQISELRSKLESEFIAYDRIINFMQAKIAVVANVGSGRSNRAKRAGLLSKHAGKTKIEGAVTDKHGNALGTEYDLGVDGAFVGMKIVVLQFYCFTDSHTKKAFSQKGFSCDWFSGKSMPNGAELRKILSDDSVTQLWLISGSRDSSMIPYFTPEHIEIIREFHTRGKALYIWGDNDPFYFQANQLLNALFHFEMSGNVPGGKVVNLCNNPDNENAPHVGFVSHLITTGLEHLFEGITIAHFEDKLIKKCGFFPLTWGTDKRLITIYKPADETGGAVMCDGAFTRLYCNVDDAGTIRYIINCACWLAVESLGKGFSLPEPEDMAEDITYSETNAFEGGICSILWEPVPIICLPVLELADPEINTSDIVLNDPLAFGEKNCEILGRNLYGLSTGKAVLDLGKDPYLRRSVAGLIPAVSLSNSDNKKLFSDELCRVFMGCKKLYSSAQLLFIASLDAILDPCRCDNYDSEIIDVVKYLLDQSLNNFYSTPDFTDIGDKIPVIKAMQQYLSVSSELVQINKMFSTVCLMSRLLIERDLLPVKSLSIIVNRSLIKLFVSNAIQFVKQNLDENRNSLLKQVIFNQVYNCWENIPLQNTGKLMEEFPSFVSNVFQKPLERYENVSGDKIINMTNITYLFYVLLEKDLRGYKIETLLQDLIKNPNVKKIWDGDNLEDSFVINKLNELFSPFKCSDSHKIEAPIPFATTYGPTVFSCSMCNCVFGDVNTEPSEKYAETVKKNRNEHFRTHYSSDGNGYPTNTSHHFSIHRIVQDVMKLYPDSKTLEDNMIKDVSNKVIIAKGNIYRRNIDEIIKMTISSYLDCRNNGQADPESYINFYDRYLVERNHILGITPK